MVIEHKRLPVGDAVEQCHECGYTGGFHVVVERRSQTSDTNALLLLRCPGCHATFDIGWVGSLVG